MENNSDEQKSDMHDQHVLGEDKNSRVELVNKAGEEESYNNNNSSKNTVSRVCHICGKEFSSGKGLGGHLRSHYQKARKEAYVSQISESKKQKAGYENSDEVSNIRRREIKKMDNAVEDPSHNCRLCPRTFQSDKSLYGHMRWHKERDWRGIEPPADWIYDHRPSSSSSPLSSLSDADQHLNIADSSDRVVDEQKVAVDLTEGLVGWKITARRGRKALTGSSDSEISSLAHDPQLKEAADILVLMSSGAVRKTGCASEIDRYSAEIGKGKKIEQNDVEETGIVLAESVSNINGDLEGFKSIKKRKVAGFCGLGSSGAVEIQKNDDTMHTFRTRDEPPGESSNVLAQEEEEEEDVEVKVRSSHKHSRLLDLNEPPQLEDGGGKE